MMLKVEFWRNHILPDALLLFADTSIFTSVQRLFSVQLSTDDLENRETVADM